MAKKMKKCADGGLIEKAAGAINNRQKVLDAAEAAAVGLKSTPPPTALVPKPVTSNPNPNVLTEAQAKAARFKFERENPGKTYVPPKMANGGYLPFRSQSPFIDSTTPPPQGTPAKPTPGLQNGLFAGYADGGEVGSFFGLPDHAKIATNTWELPKFVTGYASGGIIPGRNMWGGMNNTMAPMMGGYGGGNAAMLDPARAVSHTSGLRTMNRGGVFESMPEEQKQWVPDSPEKQQMYIAAAAANQNAGSTIGGQDIVSSLRKQSHEGMSPVGWNNMVDNMKQGSGGYPMAADGGYVGYADGGAVLRNGLRETPMLASEEVDQNVDLVGPPSFGKQLSDGWREGAIVSKSQARITKFLQSYKDGGQIGKPKLSPSGGGAITGKGGPTEDRQPILASPGEYIIPADTVQKVGKDKLDQMVDATHEPVAGKGLRGFANGGYNVDTASMEDWANARNAMKTGIAGRATTAAESLIDAATLQARNVTPTGTPLSQTETGVRAAINRAAGSTGKGAVKIPGSGLAKGMRPLAVNLLPAYALASAAETGGTSTEDYRKRFGIDRPKGASPLREAVGDLGVRTLGAASDLVNPLGVFNRFYKDKVDGAAARNAQAMGPAKPEAAAAPEVPAEVPVAQAPQPDSGDSTYKDVMAAANAQAAQGTAAPALTTEEANQRARETMAAMDAANAQKERLNILQKERMHNATNLSQTKYEAEQAANEAKRFKYDVGSRRDAAQKMALYSAAQQANESGIDRQGAAIEAPLARAQQTKMGELTSKTALAEHQMGLRGQMYGANLGLAQHLADRRLQLYKMRYDMSNMTTEQKEKYINSHPSVMDPVLNKDGQPTGEYKANPKKVQALADAVRNAKGTPDPLTPMSEQMPFIDEQARRKELDPTGQAFGGAPTQADYRRGLSYKDLSLFHPKGAKEDSTVGLGDYVQSFMPESLVGAESNATVTLHGYGGRPLIVSAGEYQDAVRKGTLRSLIQKYSTGQAANYTQDTRIQK